MGPLIWTLFALALAASAAVAIEAFRRPILFRMAARNARRRPRQTATVIAGLMVGTAIISAALVAGQSTGSAIRGVVYDALGEVDETVRLDAFNFYPEQVLEDFRDDPDVAAYFDGISANVIWTGAATNQRTDLFEPATVMVGYDPGPDADFRPFELAGGGTWDGTELGANQAIITKGLADATDSAVGDRIQLRFTPPVDPVVPEITPLQGTLLSAGGGIVDDLLEPLLGPAPTSATIPVTVDEGASRFVVVLGWDPTVVGAPLVQMQLRLTAPDGQTWDAPNDPTAIGAVPHIIDVEAPTGNSLDEGTWTVRITATVAVNTPYAGAAVVLYPIYDFTDLESRGGGFENPDLGPFADAVEALNPFADVRTLNLTVAAITDGGRGDQFDFEDAVFFRMDEAQAAFDREDQVNVIKFSNPGGIIAGRAGTDRAVELLNGTLETIKERYPDQAAIQELKVFPVKENFVQLADDAGQFLTGLLLFAGSLSVITGLLLIVNIFTMLAEERRSELGMARAVGLTRRDLVRLFLFEGSLYAIAAAAIGALLGVGLAALMIAGLNSILAGLDGGFPPVQFQASPSLLIAAFASGALLTFATIAVSSRRISRLNIVRAIRQIDEPERSGSRFQVLAGIPLAIGGALLTAWGWLASPASGVFSLQVFGALMLVVGLSMALRRTVARRRLNPLLAAALALYYAFTYFTINDFADIQEANIVGPIRGVILTLCVVILAVHFEQGPRWLGRALSRVKSLRAVAVPAMAYPQHKRFRTGMTLAMFSIVILSIGFFSIFGGLFDRPVEAQTGGFHIEATTTLEVDDLSGYDRGLVPSGMLRTQILIEEFNTQDVGLITVSGEKTGQFGPPHHHVFGMDDAFVEAQSFRLLWRLPEYATDADAYQAVLERDDVVIVAYTYSTDEQGRDLSHEVGETLQIHVGDAPREFTIIGIQEQFHFPGVFLPRETVQELFGTSTTPLYLFQVNDGVDHEAAAKLLEQNYRDVGMNAEASEVLVTEEQETVRQILGAMKLFLGLGLIVGVLSLGIVTARSVIERRQEIGMLRALGYTRTMIRRIFMIEMTAVVVLGAAIGILCSILVSFGLWYSIIRELQYPYVIPWGEILLLVGISYAVALMATAAPIRRASRVAPAEALRYSE